MKVADIIEQNAFRVLGLPVTTKEREITKRAEELEAYVVTGQIPTFDTDFQWVGDMDRSKASIKRATQILFDPSLKLQHSLFWFWEFTSVDRLAMKALRVGDVEEAFTIWNSTVEEMDLNSGNVSHLKNLAVLLQITSCRAATFDHQRFLVSIESWGKAFSSDYLGNKLRLLYPDSEAKIVTNRLAEFVGDVLHSSVKEYLSTWTKENNWENAIAYFRAFSRGGFSDTVQNRIIEFYTAPIIETIETLCQEMQTKLFSSMDDLLISVKDFRNSVYPEIDKLKKILPAADPSLELWCDRVAKIIRDKAIHYGNTTKDWINAQLLLDAANDLVLGPLLRETLRQDLIVVNKNAGQQKFFGEPITQAPALWTFNGFGKMLYGSWNYDSDTNSYETTLYFVAVFIPIFPLARYRVIKEGDKYRFLGKLPFRPFEKWHLGLGVAGILALFLILVGDSSKNSNTYQNYSPETSIDAPSSVSTGYSNQPPNQTAKVSDSDSKVADSLASEIEADRDRLKDFESRLQSISSLLDSYKKRMDYLKSEIEAAESKLAGGLYIDESVYDSNIKAYNTLVKKYNSKSEEDRRLYEIYDNLLKSINVKIDRHNRLIGGK